MFTQDALYSKILENYLEELKNGSILEIGSADSTIFNYCKHDRSKENIDEYEVKLNYLKIKEEEVNQFLEKNIFYDYVICTDTAKLIEFNEKAIANCINIARIKCFFITTLDNIGISAAESKFKNNLKICENQKKYDLVKKSDANKINSYDVIDTIFKSGYEQNIIVNETVVQHFGSLLLDIFLFDDDASNFHQIISIKNKITKVSLPCGDLPFSILNIVDKSKKIILTDDKLKNIKNNFSIYSKITAFSVFHKTLGIENIFRFIKPFFVNKEGYLNFLKIEEPFSFFEENNDRCSELSAIHNIWKRNLYSEIVSISHYRRYLYLFPEDIIGYDICIHNNDFDQKIGKIENSEQIHYLLAKYDLIVSKPGSTAPTNYSNEFYYSLNNCADDYYKCMEIILKNHPYLEGALVESMSSFNLYACNLFICSNAAFNAICNVWFDVLQKYANEKGVIDGRTEYQTRDIAFLSERVFDIIIRHMKNLGYKVGELPILFVDS